MDQHRSNPTPPGTTLPPLQARKYLGRFGLHGDLALQPVKFLSGGQKSRLAFAELAWWGGPREAQGRSKGGPREAQGPRPKAQGPRPKEVKGPTRQEAKIFLKIQGTVTVHSEMSISSTMFHGIAAEKSRPGNR